MHPLATTAHEPILNRLDLEHHHAGHGPARVYLAGLPSEHSRRRMLQALARIVGVATGQPVPTDGPTRLAAVDAFPWRDLRAQHTAAIRARLLDGLEPRSVNATLSALRGVLRASWRIGELDADTYQRAADLARVQVETLPRGRSLTQGELAALFRACGNDPTPAGRRDAALLALLYGLRRAEAVSLDLDDYDGSTGRLAVRHAKGRRQRVVFLANGQKRAIDDWIVARGNAPGPILNPISKAGRIEHRPMTAQAAYLALAKRARQAGIADISPHDLRRTLVGDLLDAGADLAIVQALVGHASPATTSRYDRRPEGAKARAAGLLACPYMPPR